MSSDSSKDLPAATDDKAPKRFHEFRQMGDVAAAIPVLNFLGIRAVEPSAEDVVVTLEMDRTRSVLNLADNPHGAAIAALVDHAGGLAVSATLGHGGPTTDLHVRYLRPADGSPIRADARALRAGRRLAVVEVRVYGVSGKLSAIGTVTLAPMPEGPPTQD